MPSQLPGSPSILHSDAATYDPFLMVQAFLVATSRGTQDAACGLVSSIRRHHPDAAVYVLVSGRVTVHDQEMTVLRLEDLVGGLGVAAVTTLGEDDQAAFALPWAFERILAAHSSVVYAQTGCLVAQPLGEVARRLEANRLVLVSPSIARELHSATPSLVALTQQREPVGRWVVALRDDSQELLARWQETMRESFFDVLQRRPVDFLQALFWSFAGREGVGVAGEETLTNWTDFAAIESGRAVGPRAAVVQCDALWALGRQEASSYGRDVEVEWQLLADKVHDSRPLDALMEFVREGVARCPVDAPPTPFEVFSRELRRSADPNGSRWNLDQEDQFLQWLFEANQYGLTRLAHLYWRSRIDLQEHFPEVRFDPSGLRRWNDERALIEFGMDLFDPGAIPVKIGRVEEAEKVASGGIAHAVEWRLNVLRSLVPGHVRRQKLREMRQDPAFRRGVAPPKRIEVVRQPSLFGASPRELSLIGCFRAESGLGQAARASLNALRLLGREFCYVDTSEEYPSRNAVDPGLDKETFGAFGQVNLLHSNADELITLSQRVFRNRLAGRFNAAMWFWESADLPERSRPAFDIVDELWVASEYLADVFGQYGKVPVHVIGLAAELPKMREARRADFGLRDDEFVFLFVYDALSAHGRKNPELAMDAFVKAFAPNFDGVRFVLKVSNLNKFPASQSRLKAMAEQYPAITLIDEYFTRERVMDLMAAADVSVSLHAAEGFGLTLLESMALGTPVICTGYSGNMDFTTDENSWLIDYRMMATERQTGPYPPGSVWAFPNVDSAADVMRMAAANRSEVERKARRAMADAKEAASLERYAKRLDEQLRRVL